MIKLKNVSIAFICLSILVPVFFITFEKSSEAKPITEIKGSRYEVSFSLNDNLKIYTGRNVLLHLRSGKTLQGYVKSVGDHFVHIEKLAERDFYDALIRIEDISAIEAKFRDMK